MKQFLFAIFTLVTSVSYSQSTYVPDDNFEAYLESYGMGNGILNDDSVLTANISGVMYLSVPYLGIADLTGIEDFTALISLNCIDNELTFLNLSQNVNLVSVLCSINHITSLDLSGNPSLQTLYCNHNPLVSLNLSQNVNLETLGCFDTELSSIDLSQNSTLNIFRCYNTQLTSLDLSHNAITFFIANNNPLKCVNIKNGYNSYIQSSGFSTFNCPQLTCIEVDDEVYSSSNWTNIDGQSYFSTNCLNPCELEVEEIAIAPKTVVKIVDIFGREVEYKANTLLLYIYTDGTQERVFSID